MSSGGGILPYRSFSKYRMVDDVVNPSDQVLSPNKAELVKSFYNNLIGPQVQSYSSGPLTHNDIRSKHIREGKTLPWPSQIANAMVKNSAARQFASVLCPTIRTNGKQFETMVYDPFVTQFTEMAEMGVPNVQMSAEHRIKKTLTFRKLAATLEANFAEDVNFGMEAMSREMAQLGHNLSFTLALQIITALYSNSQLNTKVILMNGEDRFRAQDLLRLQENAFCAAGFGLDTIASLVSTANDVIPLDTIVFSNVGSRFTEYSATSRKLTAARVEKDPNTRELVNQTYSSDFHSIATIPIGTKKVDILSVPDMYLRIGKRMRKFGMRRVVHGSVFFLPKFSVEDPIFGGPGQRFAHSLCIRDMDSTKHNWATLMPGECVANCVAYDDDGNPSQFLKEHGNDETRNKRLPTSLFSNNLSSGYASHSDEIDSAHAIVTGESMGQPGTPIEDMPFRDTTPFLTWSPGLKKYVAPKELGGFHLANIPPKYMKYAAEEVAVAIASDESSRNQLSYLLQRVITLMTNMRHQDIDEMYARDFIDVVRAKGYSPTDASRAAKSGHTVVNDAVGDGITGAVPMKFTSNSYDMIYPAGFESWAGIRYLATLNPMSVNSFSEVILECKEIVSGFERSLQSGLRKYIGSSLMLDSEETPIWFTRKDSFSKCLDVYFHVCTGARDMGPLFLGFTGGAAGDTYKLVHTERLLTYHTELERYDGKGDFQNVALVILSLELKTAFKQLFDDSSKKQKDYGMSALYLLDMIFVSVFNEEGDFISNEAVTRYEETVKQILNSLKRKNGTYSLQALNKMLGITTFDEESVLKLDAIQNITSKLKQKKPTAEQQLRSDWSPRIIDGLNKIEGYPAQMAGVPEAGNGEDVVVRTSMKNSIGWTNFLTSAKGIALRIYSGNPRSNFDGYLDTDDKGAAIKAFMVGYGEVDTSKSNNPLYHDFVAKSFVGGRKKTDREDKGPEHEHGLVGPYYQRIAFAEGISDHLTKLIYLQMVYAKNVASTFLNADKAGACYFAPMYFATRQTIRALNMVLLNRASVPLMEVVGPIRVVPMEDGISDRITVVVEYYSACISMDAEGMISLYDVLPLGLDGGFRATIIRNLLDIIREFTIGKDLLCLPSPLGLDYASPIHLLNEPAPTADNFTSNRPEQKHCNGRFIKHCLTKAFGGEAELRKQVKDESTFGRAGVLAFNCKFGAISTYDVPKNQWTPLKDGDGELGNARTHYPGAQETFNGKNNLFPVPGKTIQLIPQRM